MHYKYELSYFAKHSPGFRLVIDSLYERRKWFLYVYNKLLLLLTFIKQIILSFSYDIPIPENVFSNKEKKIL